MQLPKRVALIIADYPIYEKYCPNFCGMQDGLKTLGIEFKVFSCRPIFKPEPVIAYEPDFVLYGLLDIVRDRPSRLKIREALPNAKIVMWYGDYRDDSTGQIRADMGEIDCMFVSNNAQSEFYERKWNVPRCRFMPLGATIHEVQYNRLYDFDFVFIGGKITGSLFLARARMIYDFQKQGLRTIDADARTQTALRAKILKAMPSIYASSKAVLDISHFTDVDGYTSNRFWVVGAAAAAAVTKRFPGCEKFYPEDSRAYFDTFEEAIKLAERLKTDVAYREGLRKRAREVAKEHTYDKRFLAIFKEVYGE